MMNDEMMKWKMLSQQVVMTHVYTFGLCTLFIISLVYFNIFDSIVLSQWKTMLQIFGRHLDANRIPHTTIDGW